MKENEIRTTSCKNCGAESREFVFNPFEEPPALKEDGWASLMIHVPEDMAKPPEHSDSFLFYLCNSCSRKLLKDLVKVATKKSPDLYKKKVDDKEKTAWVL